MIPLFGLCWREPLARGKRDVLEGRLISIALQALRLETSVVLDFGFWSRDERSSLRWLARSAGASCQVVYLPVDRDAQLARIARRQLSAPHQTYLMTEVDVDRWREQFQAPDAAELVVMRSPGRLPGGRAGRNGQRTAGPPCRRLGGTRAELRALQGVGVRVQFASRGSAEGARAHPCHVRARTGGKLRLPAVTHGHRGRPPIRTRQVDALRETTFSATGHASRRVRAAGHRWARCYDDERDSWSGPRFIRRSWPRRTYRHVEPNGR